MDKKWKYALSGAAGGLVNGLFGGGEIGGAVALGKSVDLGGRSIVKKRCVAVILPFCVLSAAIYLLRTGLRLLTALPYLLGGLVGGFVGGKLFKKMPSAWLRRLFGVFLLYGGVRYLL